MALLSNPITFLSKRSSVLPVVALAPRKESQQTSTALQQVTLFPYASAFQRPQIVAATLTFRLQSVGFRKSQALPFFLALELLTGQKPIATLAKRNVPA
jgi:ribosomal protein L5